MQTILIAGAGKSSIYLIEYFLSLASKSKWKIIVADNDGEIINEKINGNPNAEAAVIDITKESQREPLVKRADIVISMMPPHLHIHLAKDCLKHKKHLITSSYISPEMREMSKAVKDAGLMFMCEMGLDPGLDHMTASDMIHSIQRVAAVITSFKSYCGGLVSPESDNNPWHYKITWNPRNIVMAGSKGGKYLSNGKEVEVPYKELFDNPKKIKIGDMGQFAFYPNRDSMDYIEQYELHETTNFMRATLRHPNFCKGWNALIQLGLTDDKEKLNTQGMTYLGWLKEVTSHSRGPIQAHLAKKLNISADDKIISMMQWLGMFDERIINQKKATSAQVLEELVTEKMQMNPKDKDMVVLQHEVEYVHKDKKTKAISTMVLKGENSEYTAMAKAVGLPIAVLARLVLQNKIRVPVGVLIPNMAAVYRPVLTELRHHGIEFIDEVVE